MSESVRAQQRCKNNMKVIPTDADRIEKREKHNKYILATHGPLSRFAVRIGYVPPQKYVKHYAPSGSKFLRILGLTLTWIRQGISLPPSLEGYHHLCEYNLRMRVLRGF